MLFTLDNIPYRPYSTGGPPPEIKILLIRGRAVIDDHSILMSKIKEKCDTIERGLFRATSVKNLRFIALSGGCFVGGGGAVPVE